jgi:hypothetical protein
VNRSLGRAAIAAMIVFGAARANAQITTVIAAPKPPPPNPQQVAQRVQATQDSIARVTLTGMTQWVDSAAAAMALKPDTASAPTSTVAGGDTAAQTPARRDTAATTVPPQRTDEFRNGARAPNTATATPAIAVAGALLVFVGFALTRRPKPARSRVRR